MNEPHTCKFYGHTRVSPGGGNRRGVSVIVGFCQCGKIKPKFPDKLTFFDRRWVARVNRRAYRSNHELHTH